jgi:hypothetical protein
MRHPSDTKGDEAFLRCQGNRRNPLLPTAAAMWYNPYRRREAVNMDKNVWRSAKT